jgi:hypothetical protein
MSIPVPVPPWVKGVPIDSSNGVSYKERNRHFVDDLRPLFRRA